MTNYSRGATFERDVKKDMERHGWLVTRAAGSHGLWDLKAIAPGPIVALVQCKRDGRLAIDDRRSLRDIASAFDCIPILSYKDDGIKYAHIWGENYVDWHPSIEGEAAA